MDDLALAPLTLTDRLRATRKVVFVQDVAAGLWTYDFGSQGRSRNAEPASALGGMTLLAKCISYVVIVSVVSLSFAVGAMWLLRPEAGAARAAHTPPLPPRIADSIERKKEPPAPPPVIAARPALPETTLQEANVALHNPSPRQAIRELKVQRPASPRRAPVQEARSAQMQASTAIPLQASAAIPPSAAVTTARSDVPY